MATKADLRTGFARAGECLYDFCTLRPEGNVHYKEDGKEAYGVFSALLAFVATQSGALTLAEQVNLNKSLTLSIYLTLSAIAIILTLILIRLPALDDKDIHYYEKGSVLYGKFVLYVSVIATVCFAVGFALGLFSTRQPRFAGTQIPMSTPTELLTHISKTKSLAADRLSDHDVRTMQRWADVMVKGIKKVKEDKGNVFVSWSLTPFDKAYDDIMCELFSDIASSEDCYPFLYSAYPVKHGDLQISLRPLYFEIQSGDASRRFAIEAPRLGDRVLLIFWSEGTPRNEPRLNRT